MVGVDDKTVEIQIRTELQHQWAELSEKLAASIDQSIKYGGGPDWVQETLRAGAMAVAGVESREYEPSNPVVARVKQELKERFSHAILRVEAERQSP